MRVKKLPEVNLTNTAENQHGEPLQVDRTIATATEDISSTDNSQHRRHQLSVEFLNKFGTAVHHG